MRRGVYKVPLILTWVAIGGGFDQPNIYNLANFVRAIARRRGADAGKQHAQRAADQHDGDRDGPARALRHRGQHLDPGPQDQDEARSSRSSSWCASRASSVARSPTRKEARQIYRIGTFYKTADETLAANGFAPNRQAEAARRLKQAA